ncbi:MAG: helix-turn-helix domain-containing protein [Rubripirellula sp.]
MHLVELAQRNRNHRWDQRLTLEEVAARSGLTHHWLSKVEDFRITPSLPSLGQIASAFGVTVAKLVEGLDEKPQLNKVAKPERKVVEQNRSLLKTTVCESLAHKRLTRSMAPLLLTASSGVARDEALSHEAKNFLMEQRGAINFEFDGKVHSLRNGDSLYFDSHVPHRIINPHMRDATVMCVFFNPPR